MSNRLAIDPSEIKLSDPQTTRHRIWQLSPKLALIAKQRDERVERARRHAERESQQKLAEVERLRIAALVDQYRMVEIVGVPPMAILRKIAALYGLCPADITSDSRMSMVVAARQHAMYELRKTFTNMSSVRIGKIFGGKDHSTVLTAIKRHAKLHGLTIPESNHQLAHRIARRGRQPVVRS